MHPAKVTVQHTQRHRAKHGKDVNINGEGRRRVFRPVLNSPYTVTWCVATDQAASVARRR